MARTTLPRWVDHNTIQVPATARADDGTIGDGSLFIKEGDKDFVEWEEWLSVKGAKRPE